MFNRLDDGKTFWCLATMPGLEQFGPPRDRRRIMIDSGGQSYTSTEVTAISCPRYTNNFRTTELRNIGVYNVQVCAEKKSAVFFLRHPEKHRSLWNVIYERNPVNKNGFSFHHNKERIEYYSEIDIRCSAFYHLCSIYLVRRH